MSSHRYANLPTPPDAPPAYKPSCIRISESDVRFVMPPIRQEIGIIAQRQARNRAIRRYVKLTLTILIPLFLCALLGVFMWFWLQSEDSTPPEASELRKEESSERPYCNKRFIGYYQGMENRMITEKQIEHLTHIVFDGVRISENGTIEFKSDSTRKMFEDMKKKVRDQKPEMKILFSGDELETVDNGITMAKMLETTKNRKNWIDSISSFLTAHEIDGVELSCRSNQTADKKFMEDLASFTRELRYKFTNVKFVSNSTSSYLINVVLSPNGYSQETEEVLKNLLDSVDVFNVDTTMYHHGNIGPLAPLYSSNGNGSIDWIMRKYACSMGSPSKFQFVMPFDGAIWSNFKTSKTSFFPIDAKFDGNFVQFKEIQESGVDVNNAPYDDEAKSAYIGKVLYFENERSMKDKVEYMLEKNLGGVTVRRLEFDDNMDTLLKAVMEAMEKCKERRFQKDEVRYNC